MRGGVECHQRDAPHAQLRVAQRHQQLRHAAAQKRVDRLRLEGHAIVTLCPTIPVSLYSWVYFYISNVAIYIKLIFFLFFKVSKCCIGWKRLKAKLNAYYGPCRALQIILSDGRDIEIVTSTSHYSESLLNRGYTTSSGHYIDVP